MSVTYPAYGYPAYGMYPSSHVAATGPQVQVIPMLGSHLWQLLSVLPLHLELSPVSQCGGDGGGGGGGLGGGGGAEGDIAVPGGSGGNEG